MLGTPNHMNMYTHNHKVNKQRRCSEHTLKRYSHQSIIDYLLAQPAYVDLDLS